MRAAQGATEGSRRGSGSSPAVHTWADIVGATLLALLGGVTLASSRGDRSEVLLLLLAIAVALTTGRVAGTARRVLAPAVVVVVASAVAIAAALSDHRSGLLSYGAAVAALLVQGAIAAAMLAIAVARPVAARSRWARPAVVVAALLFLVVLATSVVLGATYRGDDAPGGSVTGVAERRVVLWHAALEILSERPAGVGPGRFDDVPPRFLPEGDVRWAESGFLQQGAELGWLGLILTVLLFLWGFARLWVHPSPDAYVAFGAVALAALGIAAAMTHVLHVPIVPLVTAALVGSAQAVTGEMRIGPVPRAT